jgi:hypothetical protein
MAGHDENLGNCHGLKGHGERVELLAGLLHSALVPCGRLLAPPQHSSHRLEDVQQDQAEAQFSRDAGGRTGRVTRGLAEVDRSHYGT